MWVLGHIEPSENTTMHARIEIELFHVTKKTDPSGRPKNTLTRGETRKGEPTPLPPKGAPETHLLKQIIYKNVVHRTQKRTPKNGYSVE